MGQNNANAANNVNNWTDLIYILLLLGGLSPRLLFRAIQNLRYFSSYLCDRIGIDIAIITLVPGETQWIGDERTPCGPHSTVQTGLSYESVYLVALGYEGYQSNILTFGANQFVEEHAKESRSKVAFFSYFYLALNLGLLVSNTILGYFENEGMWALRFWVSIGSAVVALMLFLVGTTRYPHFSSTWNPWTRFCHRKIS